MPGHDSTADEESPDSAPHTLDGAERHELRPVGADTSG